MSPLEIRLYVLGPLGNNSYLIWDPSTLEAAAIDPSFESELIVQVIQENQLTLRYILLTHTHFDHIAGVNVLHNAFSPRPQIGIHSLELPLWKRNGAASEFGFSLPQLPDPDLLIVNDQELELGSALIRARFTPGHTPGHIVYNLPASGVVFTGDLIFFRGIGRTDMLGGNSADLFRSIDEKILTLPPATRLLSGHGPETTVADEIANNPFI